MQTLRILTFNWHDPYLSMFAKIGHQIEVGDWMVRADGTCGWDLQKRPLPDNLRLIRHPREAADMLQKGACDLVVCHTIRDLVFVAPFDVPTVFLSHNALHNDALNDEQQMEKIREEVGRFLSDRNGVFAAISPMKLESWGLDGFVVRPGIDLRDYSGYTGDEAVALSVGNLFVERDYMLGYRYLKQVLEGLPHRLVGENPKLPEARKAESWEDLKAVYRCCRVYVNTTVEAFEDGYNLGMLEAMATGMPVVSLANKTSPIRNGENGYTSEDTTVLRERAQALLKDGELARELGAEARRTVADDFSVEAFVARWNEIFEACLQRHSAVSVTPGDQPEEPTLRFERADLFPFDWEDVQAFLDVESLEQIVMPRLKLDRVGNSFLCDLFLYNRETGRQMVWQGLEVLPGLDNTLNVGWPPYLKALDGNMKDLIERAVSDSVAEVKRQNLDGVTFEITLNEVDGFTTRVGEDRVTPGGTRADAVLHHTKRYVFARQFCRGKRVVDIGCGTGYGCTFLSREAKQVVGLDLSPEAVQYAERAYGSGSIHRLAGDARAMGLRSGQFDAAVCFEMIEHVREHDLLLSEVRRLLRLDGTFVVSTPNKCIYDRPPQNENPYHVAMLELDEFQRLLERHFETVSVYGQMRAQKGDDFYRMFDFRESADENDEVFVAVCAKPRAEALPDASGEQPVEAPAVHVRPSEGEAQGDGRRLKVLFGHLSNPISAGRSYVDAFRSAHDVITCGPALDAEALAEWRKAEAEHVLKPEGASGLDLLARLVAPCDIPMPRGQVDIGQALERLPKGWRPDLFVWFESAGEFLPVGLEKLDCPTACLVGDTHTGQIDWRIQYADLFRDVFVMYARQHIPDFQGAGCERTHWLPAACDPVLHGRIPAGKAYDVGFVGQTHRQWHPHRVRLLKRLIQAGFDVRIESKILEEMALLYSRSRIVFNRSLNEDLNRRVFEALCSGSLLLTDRLPPESGLEELFRNREHLVIYDEENLEELVRYYLEHEAEREEIAAFGREAVLGDHTYAHRADQVVEAVFETEGIATCVGEDNRETHVQRSAGGGAEPVDAQQAGEVEPKEQAQCFLQNWTGPIRLNLGCGEDRLEGYINVDAYVETADLRMDIFNLDFEDETVDEVFSSHMLEHLAKYEVPRALAEWRRVLKPGGCLRLSVPDLEWVLKEWLATPEEHRWAWRLDTIFGLQTHEGEYHKTGFTAARMEQVLTEAGFARARVSWTWSHGFRCLWVEAVCADEAPGVERLVDLARFEGQFPTEMSGMVPYDTADCVAFFEAEDWRVGFVSFERLPMDGADYTVNVAVKRADRQMVLQGMRVFNAKQQPILVMPEYLRAVPEEAQARLNDAIGQALRTKLADANYQEGGFVIARFGDDAELGLAQTGERMIPGLTDYSLYIPHVKRYLLAQRFAENARVLDAGCGTGYGAKLLARVADRVDAVDLSRPTMAFAERTYPDEKIAWQEDDLRTFDPEAGAYDLVVSFEVIEHLEQTDIPAYLERLHRALKPGGTALISTPNRLVAQQWDNPHHRCEMTLEAFRETVGSAFSEVTMLGQTVWSEQTEVPGQCAISGRVTEEDDMYIAVCRKGEISAMPENGPRVSIVMPLYNQVDYTQACLKALEETSNGVPHELILVDNGSSDATGALLDRMAGQARVIRNGENLGFARGNNIGAKQAQGDYLVFLNNDTAPHAGWLKALVEEADADSHIGVVGAKLLYPDTGRIQHAGIELINGVPDHVCRQAAADDPKVNQARDLDMVTGACLLIRRELFDRLGGFDEGYVNGVEDVDLCLRVREAGYRVRYCPASVLDHHEGSTEGRYDHVRPNLERFVARWNGWFDGEGRFAMPGAPVEQKPETGMLRGCWEGTQFVYHSLSLVNMALTSELIGSGACELQVIPYEPAAFGPEVDPERYAPIAERIGAELSGPAQFHVRHQWPPDFTPPPSGHWVMIQPWEFGRIPKAWVEPIREAVDEVWVPSSYVKQCYVDSGIDPDRVQVIPNGVRTELLHPGAPPMALETEKSIKFLFVGGAIYRKGIDVLLKTYRETFTRSDDVCLVIKGMGDETFYKGQTPVETIRKLQADPEAPEVLYLTDDLTEEQMAGLYTACDCLVHPYRGEGFGMPVAEAMACGLPVVVTQGGACDDFCTDDRAYFVPAVRREIAFEKETAGPAWLLEPDADALAAQMRAVAADPEGAHEKGRKGSVYVREHLSWARAAERVVERLRGLQETPVRSKRP